jgi:monoamine oxidase
MDSHEEAGVVVVGAGIAGLAAARRLAEGGADVLVLEASDRVGGRTVNEPISGSQMTEMGGQWVGPTQDRVLALIEELGLETFPTRTEGQNVIEIGGRLRRYRGTIPKLSPLVLADLAFARFRLGRAVRRVDPAAPWMADSAAELDSMTLGDWIDRNTRTRQARDLIALSCKTVWGAEPSELSLLWALSYMAAGGGFEKLLDVEGGAQQDRVVGGSALIAERMAAALGDRVRLKAPVRDVAWSDEGVEVAFGESAVKAARAVLAMPPALLGYVAFDPSLPDSHAALANAWRGGSLIKVTALYDEPFWRKDGLSGEGVGTTGSLSIAFDNTPPSGDPGALVGSSAAPMHRGTRSCRPQVAARWRWADSSGCSARRRSKRPDSSSATGLPRNGPAAARSRTWVPVSSPGTGAPSASPPARFISRRPSTPPRGAATWTERCARVRRPQLRSSKRPSRRRPWRGPGRASARRRSP